MVIAVGCTAPAPTPCRRRKAISDGIDQAKPQRSDPTRKIAIPDSMTTLRPLRSESLPNTTVVAVWVSRKAANTQL